MERSSTRTNTLAESRRSNRRETIRYVRIPTSTVCRRPRKSRPFMFQFLTFFSDFFGHTYQIQLSGPNVHLQSRQEVLIGQKNKTANSVYLEPHILRRIAWSDIDQLYRRNREHLKDLWFQKFCSSTGFMRFFPGQMLSPK